MTRALELRWRPAVASLGPLAALLRIRACAVGGVLGLLGAGLAGDATRGWPAAASLGCAIGFAMVVNDIADDRVDRHGKPHRPLPSGALSVPAARALAGGCAALCLLAAAPRAATLAFALVLLGLSWLYSVRLKNTVLAGNLLVAGLASSTVSFGAVAAGGVPLRVLAVQAVLLTFSLAFEILKTAIDVRGDAAAGVRTVATRFGVPATARFSAVVLLAFVAATPWPALRQDRPLPYLLAIAAGGVLPALLAAALLIRRGRTVADLALPFRLLRLMWLSCLLALLLVQL